jgi:hypothetical protein
MKIIPKFTVTCCGLSRNYREEYLAVEGLMRHIRKKHKDILAKLESRGRVLARSQNGCGYYDGSDSDTGWPLSPETFKEAWRRNALREMLKQS